MNYEEIFAKAVDTVRGENRYRVFANLQRLAGEFPYARNHGRGPKRVVVWCSNDYLAQGQNPVVLKALSDAALDRGRVPVGPAISPARITCTLRWSVNSPICTARKRLCCSPPATFPTRQPFLSLARCFPGCVIFLGCSSTMRP